MLMVQDVLGARRTGGNVLRRSRINGVGTENVQRNTTGRTRGRIAAHDVRTQDAAGTYADCIDGIRVIRDIDVFGLVEVMHPTVNVANLPVVLTEKVALETRRNAEGVTISMVAAVEDIVRAAAETDPDDIVSGRIRGVNGIQYRGRNEGVVEGNVRNSGSPRPRAGATDGKR